MNIYAVSYIGEDDTTQHDYFTNKSEAVKHHSDLKKLESAPPSDDSEDERVIKLVFDLKTMNCEISKKGIISLLNRHFSNTQ